MLIMIPGAFVASTAVYSILPVSTGRNCAHVLVSGIAGAILASVFVLVWLVPYYRGRGRRMGQNDLLNGLCADTSSLRSIHSKADQ